MITISLPEPSGNAVRLLLAPPADARHWRILRNVKDDFTTAVQVYSGTDEMFVDTVGLVNEVTVFYRVEYTHADGSVTQSPSSWATPRATYEDYTTDVMELLRDRIEAGLAEEVKRGTLHNDLGYIQVLTAPPSLQNNLSLPLVTLILDAETPTERFISDDVDEDDFIEDSSEWVEQAGWLANVDISITGWSLNPTERIELRKALRRVLIANFNVFAARGIVLPQFNLSDSDAVSGEFDAPLYLVNGSFSCTAPVRVGLKTTTTIVDVITEVNN
ncbi:hypothetical protein F7430_22345 [Salmonella enterica]|nr:hypothetical protein [Salmonella enterica]EFF4796103.1 hypothetical protein [Escherichia coli]ECO7324696.1 hypothetical protein [Salmonella enterica]ECZ0806887.1 hypothetical protein [Salmonella enterica]EGK7902776.1 hypothetical protein [Salmonella enterica]